MEDLTREVSANMHFNPIKDLKKATILISNDDGIDARGIKLLEEILKDICDDVWVVAPNHEKSGASHAITSDTLRSMEGHSSAQSFPNVIHQRSDKHYAVEGTPSDCIRIALGVIMNEHKPNLIISGINNGRNIADDITYSGTVGVAVEGLLHGVMSIAVSQLTDGAQIVNWDLPKIYLPEILQKICTRSYNADCLINVNFPNVPTNEVNKIQVCRHGTRRFIEGSPEIRRMCLQNLSGNYENNSVFPDDNIEIHNHNITVSALKIDLTDYEENQKLAELFK